MDLLIYLNNTHNILTKWSKPEQDDVGLVCKDRDSKFRILVELLFNILFATDVAGIVFSPRLNEILSFLLCISLNSSFVVFTFLTPDPKNICCDRLDSLAISESTPLEPFLRPRFFGT